MSIYWLTTCCRTACVLGVGPVRHAATLSLPELLIPLCLKATFPDGVSAFEGHAPLEQPGGGGAAAGPQGASAAACLVDEARAMLSFSGDYAAIGYTAKDHFMQCALLLTPN